MTKCYDIKRIDKDKLDKIIEAIEEHQEYIVEGNSHSGFDVSPFVPQKYTGKVIDNINNILEEE